MCKIIIENYRPYARALDAAAITVEVASTDFDAAAGKVVEYVSVNGHTLASNFATPFSKICDGFVPAVTQANVLPYITDTVDRLEVSACLSLQLRSTSNFSVARFASRSQRLSSAPARVSANSRAAGKSLRAFAGIIRNFECCRPRLSVRATVRGSYRQEGVLVIREGARLQCNTPGCVFTIRNIRALVMKTSSSILAERVVVEVPQVNISGIIQGRAVNIVAATLNIGSDGVLLSSDRSNTTTAVTINVSPSNLIQARNAVRSSPPTYCR